MPLEDISVTTSSFPDGAFRSSDTELHRNLNARRMSLRKGMEPEGPNKGTPNTPNVDDFGDRS